MTDDTVSPYFIATVAGAVVTLTGGVVGLAGAVGDSDDVRTVGGLVSWLGLLVVLFVAYLHIRGDIA